LVEGDAVEGVRVAEDVAAASTVVPPCEVAEEAVAGCLVADCGFVVLLQNAIISIKYLGT